MKNVEDMLERVTQWLRQEDRIPKIVCYTMLILFEVALILETIILLPNYIIATIGTYIIIRLLVFCKQKVIFKKFNKKLMEIPKCTMIIFFILTIATFVMAHYTFIAVILVAIQAIIYQNFKNSIKLKIQESIKLVDENLKENFYKRVYARYLPWNTEKIANYKIETFNFYAIKEGQNVVICYPTRPYLIEKNNTVPKKYLTEKNSCIEKSINKEDFTKYFSLEKQEHK